MENSEPKTLHKVLSYDENVGTLECLKCGTVELKWHRRKDRKPQPVCSVARASWSGWNDPTKPKYKKKMVYGQKHLLGITLKQVEEFKKDKICEICGSNERLVIDHCHKTDLIRGILCGKCNSGIGFLQDDTKLMENAIKYLTKDTWPTID